MVIDKILSILKFVILAAWENYFEPFSKINQQKILKTTENLNVLLLEND